VRHAHPLAFESVIATRKTFSGAQSYAHLTSVSCAHSLYRSCTSGAPACSRIPPAPSQDAKNRSWIQQTPPRPVRRDWADGRMAPPNRASRVAAGPEATARERLNRSARHELSGATRSVVGPRGNGRERQLRVFICMRCALPEGRRQGRRSEAIRWAQTHGRSAEPRLRSAAPPIQCNPVRICFLAPSRDCSAEPNASWSAVEAFRRRSDARGQSVVPAAPSHRTEGARQRRALLVGLAVDNREMPPGTPPRY
jgi:hypothetical protein